MTRLSNEEGRALLASKGKGGKKALGPIKMPKEKVVPYMERQLSQTPLDTVLSDIIIRTTHPAAVLIGPSRIEISTQGHELVLVPREFVDQKYLSKDNQ